MVSNLISKGFLFNDIIETRRRRKFMQNALYCMIRKTFWLHLSLGALFLTLSHRIVAIKNRSCRCFGRNHGWFKLVYGLLIQMNALKKTFRVSRSTFIFILHRIRHVLERHTITEDPVSPECRLALCLYRLGRGDYFCTIADSVRSLMKLPSNCVLHVV